MARGERRFDHNLMVSYLIASGRSAGPREGPLMAGTACSPNSPTAVLRQRSNDAEVPAARHGRELVLAAMTGQSLARLQRPV
jgi:hypothetical protein